MHPEAPRGRAGILAPLLAAAILAACAGEEPAPGPYPEGANILLVTVDTLRADHLSAYGYPRATSPVLDELASEGFRFERATVQWPKTGPSFASIFTSTYPKDNGIVRKVGTPLPQGFLMLAEVLRDKGYTTHAVVSNGAVASDFNFDQGFETYVETWKLPWEGDPQKQNKADVVNEKVLEVVESLDRTRPFFLWVHYLDPHFPYIPPGEFRQMFQDDEWFDPERKIRIFEDKPRRQLLGIGPEQVLGGSDELAYYVARYDAEIAFNDSKLGELLDHLGAEGLMDNTLTVFTSDHGESLGEHEYYFDHGRFSFQSCLGVPLVLHFPGVIPSGVGPDPVELIDVAPTILEAAGFRLEGGRWMQGRSLTGRMLGTEVPAEGPVYAKSEAGYATEGRWQKVIRDDRYKLIYAPYDSDQRWIGSTSDKPWFALYDLEEDPGETRDLTAELPDVVRRLGRELEQWWKPGSFEALVDPTAVESEDEMSEETRRQLEALGYLQ